MLRACVLLGAAAMVASAGGFWITIHSGDAPLGRDAGAAVLVEVGGCAKPSDATLAGTAEGLVNGQRRTLRLRFTPTSNPNVFAVTKQWGTEGRWVLVIDGSVGAYHSRQLIELQSDGRHRARPIKEKEVAALVESALRAT